MFWLWLEFNFGDTVFALPNGEIPTEEHNRPVILSKYCSELFARSICVNLKDFWIVCIGQDSLFCNSSLDVIKVLLWTLSQCQVTLLVPFALVTLVWLHSTIFFFGEHIPWSCPDVTVVLQHAREISLLYHSFGWLNRNYCLHLVTLRFDTISCEYVPQLFYFKCAECQFFSIDF